MMRSEFCYSSNTAKTDITGDTVFEQREANQSEVEKGVSRTGLRLLKQYDCALCCLNRTIQ